MIIERLVSWMEIAPVDKKVMAVDALVRAWQLTDLSEHERDAAEVAMTCVLDDCDVEVRLALAKALGEAANPPRHLVLALAADIPKVSLPVFANCSALLDVELIQYMKTGNDDQQKAIASRPLLSSALCAEIAMTGCKAACIELVTNPEAQLAENDFYHMAERHGHCRDLRSCLLARPDIGMRARVLLIEFYAVSLQDVDENEDEKTRMRLQKELVEVCDKATITFAAQISDEEISDLVVALIERKKLTTSFLLRSICMGNLTLFAHSLAILSGQPLHRVERILQDRRLNALHALYAKAGLPMSALNVFASAIGSWRRHLEMDNGGAPDRLPYLVTREILAGYEGKRDQIVDELLMLLRKICTETARDNARSKVAQMALENEEKRALPAPEPEQVPELQYSNEELMAFTLQFAEELADMALQNEADVTLAAGDLVAANMDSPDTDTVCIGEHRGKSRLSFLGSLKIPAFQKFSGISRAA